MAKKYKWLVILALVVLAGIFSFFIRLYHNDIKVLTDFSASYEKFDTTISDFSANKTDDLKSRATNALIELTAKANFRISSLIKNDPEIMNQARTVADFAGKELDALVNGPTKEYNDLTTQRKTTYAHFQELSK